MKQNITVYYFLEQYTVHRLCKFDLAQVVTVHKVVIRAKLNINDHRLASYWKKASPKKDIEFLQSA